MRVWTEKEATLMAWKKKLTDLYKNQKTSPKREALRDELIAILDKNEPYIVRLTEFEKRREQLLGDEHQQGWDWQAQLTGIASFLRYILPDWILNRQQGSRLRRALEKDLPKSDTQLLSKKDIINITTYSLTSDQFEQSLFYNIKEALADLNNRIEFSDHNSSKEEVSTLLERLYAIKNCLEPFYYYELMAKLYKTSPPKASLFFAERYIEEPEKATTVQNFMECFLLANQLVKHFIDQNQDETQLHHGQELLILLSMDHAFFTELVKTEYALQHSDTPDAIAPALLQLIGCIEKGQSIPFSSISTALQQKISSNTKNYTYSPLGDSGQDTLGTLTLLKTLFNDKLLHANLLVIHFARQLAERLLTNFNKNKKDAESNDDKHKGYGVGTLQNYHQTLEVICESLFRIPKTEEAFENRNFLDLNQHPQTSFIPPDIAYAEMLAVRFIQMINEGQTKLLESIREAHCQDIAFNDFTQNWILARLEHSSNSNDLQLFKQAKHALLHPIVYKINDFKRLSSLADVSNLPQDNLEKEINQELENAVERNHLLQHVLEKEAIQSVIINLYKYINSKNTTTACLQKALDEFIPKLNKYHYLDYNLQNKLKTYILRKHEQLIRADFENIPDIQIKPSINYLNQCNYHLTCAEKQFGIDVLKPDLNVVKEQVIQAIQSLKVVLEKRPFFKDDQLKEKTKGLLRKMGCYLPLQTNQEWWDKVNPTTHDLTLSIFNPDSRADLRMMFKSESNTELTKSQWLEDFAVMY